MDMELTTQNIQFYENVLDTQALHEETLEMIVPDASPDMIRVVSANGYVCVKDKNLYDASFEINGAIRGCVLYLAEGDRAVRRLEVNLPFTHKFEAPGINENSVCMPTAQLVTLEAREINSRKLAIRANIAIDAKVFDERTLSFCNKIADSSECTVEVHTKPVCFYAPIGIKEKSFTIMDDLEIPQSNPPFASMLRQNIDLSCNEIKIIGNKAIMKGVADISYTYQTKDGNVAVCEHTLPYSQIIDMEGIAENCDLRVCLSQRAAELDATHDMNGDVRFISVNIMVDAYIAAYSNERFEVVDDVYSTTHSMDARFEELPCRELCEHISRRCAVNESVETASTPRKILETHVLLEPVRLKGSAITNEAQIQVLYVGEDDALYCVQRRCNVDSGIGINENRQYMCDASATGATASVSGKEISIRFFVDYDIRELSKTPVSNLCALHTVEKLNDGEESPSVILKYVYAEQPIWNIAKKYHTTIDEIAAANGLDPIDNVEAGSMLLIPRK